MMSQQQALTYENVLEMIRETSKLIRENAEEADRRMQETDRRMQETDRRMQETANRMKETDRQMKENDRIFAEIRREMADEEKRRSQELDRRFRETSQKISALGSRIGEIVENMVGGDIVNQFRELGYDVSLLSRNIRFGVQGLTECGEIDLFLEDGDTAILIEVKTNLKTEDVVEHVERLEKFRRYINEKTDPGSLANPDKRQFVGAVAGAVVEPNVAAFAQKLGMYVIVQSGTAVEILPSPEDFVAKKW